MMETEYEYGIRLVATGDMLIGPTTWEEADALFRTMESVGYDSKIEMVERPIGEWTVCS